MKKYTQNPTFEEYLLRKYPKYPHIYNVMKRANKSKGFSWADIDNPFLDKIADNIKANVAPSTAKTYFSLICALLGKANSAGIKFPASEYEKILQCKRSKTVRTFLTFEELEKIKAYMPANDHEKSVKTLFLIGAYTGARQSDFKKLGEANIQPDGTITYVSEKTETKATIPIKPYVKELLKEKIIPLSLVAFNDILRRICRNCGICSTVKILKGGKHQEGKKWMFVSSHTARISFCTNLYLLGCDVVTISKMAGHSDVNMTRRYIACDTVNVGKKAMKFFR